MSSDFTVAGLGELTKKLSSLKSDIQKKVGREALKKSSEVLLHEARQRAPVDTGRLVGSLKTRVKTTRGGESIFEAEVYADPGKSRKDMNGAYYAHMVELGTKRMGARPFLRGAFEGKGQEALETMGETLTERFKEMEGK